MSNTKKSPIAAIYPLNYIQQGLLLHHLSHQNDLGFLNTECTLYGDFNIDVFKKSFAFIVERHEILRATIHWKNIEKPVQVIHKHKEIDVSYTNWENLPEVEQQEKWSTKKNEYLSFGAQLESGALLKIDIVKFSDSKHKLLWPMHHILLDGWSGSLLIKELTKTYTYLYNGKTPILEMLPNYKAYLNYTKKLPEDNAKLFWGSYLSDFKNVHLFSDLVNDDDRADTFSDKTFLLTTEDTNLVKLYCRKHKITINTLIQSIWSLVIAKYFNTTDVIHGTTVSGRTVDFPNIDLITGMFMNVQPVRGKIDEELEFYSWFNTLQEYHFKARNYEHINLDKLYTYFNWNANHTLFDSLLVFENYPTVEADKNILKVSDIKSGLTSTYPITLTIIPGDEIKFTLSKSDKLVANGTSIWIKEALKEAIILITSEKVNNYKTLKNELEPIERSSHNSNNNVVIKKDEYKIPKNKTELELLQIWENILGIDNISTTDNFFDIGGKSLMAVNMFTTINKKLKTKLSATTLLEFPTIKKLSKHILSDSETDAFQFIIPIRSKGTESPVFCIHGGGGYVIFFNPLAKALDDEIPVYALQPAGLNSNEKMHLSIEEMAIDYAKEIKTVQPKGPYNLLSYCFSPAVGIEIANIFEKQGDTTNLIVIDSIIKQEDFTSPERIKMRIKGFLNRLLKNPFNAIKLMVFNNYERFIEPTTIKLFASEERKNLEKIKQNLINIYVKYGWGKKHPHNVFLVLTKKADKNLNPIYINSWKDITKGDVIVNYTKGQHHQLFDAPYAENLANIIEEQIY